MRSLILFASVLLVTQSFTSTCVDASKSKAAWTTSVELGNNVTDLSDYLRQVYEFSPYMRGLKTEIEVDLQMRSRAEALARPEVTLGFEAPRWKQDSTDVRPQFRTEYGPTLNLSWTVFDWGLAKERVNLDLSRNKLVASGKVKKVYDLLQEAATAYLSVERLTEERNILKVFDTCIQRFEEMANDKVARGKAPETSLITFAVEKIGLRVTKAEINADEQRARANATKFLNLPKKLPTRKKQSKTELIINGKLLARSLPPELVEAQLRLAVAKAEGDLARVERLPPVTIFANLNLNYPLRDVADVTAGARITFDLFDKAGTDIANYNAALSAKGATVSLRATEGRIEAELNSFAADIEAQRALNDALNVQLREELISAKTTEALIAGGKIEPATGLQTCRKVHTIEKARIQARHAIRLARVRAEAILGTLGSF